MKEEKADLNGFFEPPESARDVPNSSLTGADDAADRETNGAGASSALPAMTNESNIKIVRCIIGPSNRDLPTKSGMCASRNARVE